MLLRLLCPLLLVPVLPGAVTAIHLVERTDVMNGKSFGQAGPYERIVAKVHFAIDPALPANQRVRDIGLASKNADGKVTFTADLHVIKPRTPLQGNGTILYEVSNRGRMGLLSTFNHGSAKDEFGDGLLLEHGYTLVWVGWQHDMKSGLTIEVPKASGVSGMVRSEFVPDEKTTRFGLGDRDVIRAYLVSDPNAPGTQLTVRDAYDAPRRVIPRSQWRFFDNDAVEMPSGFQPGKFYEVIYASKDPAIVGLGMAATRDIISFLKYTNAGPILLGDQSRYLKRAIGFGSSQSGRFLRTFLYQGFNADEQGRIVFDGVWAHIAGGGRGSFNHRFAQPSRDANRMSNAFYPTDLFPFADLEMVDPETREIQGLLTTVRDLKVQPKIFYTNGSYEYWGRVASLIHTTPDGSKDDGLSPDSRLYFLTGSQHGSGSFPPAKGNMAYLGNANDYRPLMRALLVQLHAWVAHGVAPSASQYPRIDRGELVTPAKLHFPGIAGVTLPKMPHQAWRVDYGPEFKTKGIVLLEPPRAGKPFTTLVPQVDRDGNETTGVRMPDISAPLGTYTGWNLRDASIGASNELYTRAGAFHPFAATKAARAAKKDPRLSVEERYSSKADYLSKIDAASEALIQQRFLLPADKARVRAQAEVRWNRLTAQ